MDTIQAAILLEKLAIFNGELEARNTIANRYTELLKNSVITPALAPERTSAWAQYTVRTPNRDALIKHLDSKGIPTAIHYPIPLNRQPVYSSYANLSFPHSDNAASDVMSLPFHPYLSTEDQDFICKHVVEFFNK